MPQLVITDSAGGVKRIAVADTSMAIRVISDRLKQLFPDKYVETVLNGWLRAGTHTTEWVSENGKKLYFRLEQ